MINVSNEGLCVEFGRIHNTTVIDLLSNCRQVLKSFKTNLLNIIFDDFSIRLLGYRTEFSCLYVPQGLNFMSIVSLCSKDEYFFYILSESPSLIQTSYQYQLYIKTGSMWRHSRL